VSESILSGGFVELAVTTRSGRDESIHHGAVVALNQDGSIAFAAGDPSLPIFPRSSTKPIQATAMVASGLTLPPRLLALVCASHDGRAEHLAGAREILASANLTEAALANTADYPLDDDAAHVAIASGLARSPLQMNCSGKHSGMLATCVHNGWSHDASYLHVDHPLQRRITEMVPEMTGEEAAHIAVDGCGAPAHAISLTGLARAFRVAATAPEGSPARIVGDAMRANPKMVGGPTRDVTLLMEGVGGLVAKDGAEGVFAVGLADGRAVALKVADGANRARPPLMKWALERLGVFGHGQRVGDVRVVART
jgi:L-asparaginase II